MAEKIVTGDEVLVIAGKDKGARARVRQNMPRQDKVIVEGVNIVKRHQRATRATMQGGIIDKDMPIDISNVALVCSSCGPTRVGYRVDDEGNKVRVCRKCGGDV